MKPCLSCGRPSPDARCADCEVQRRRSLERSRGPRGPRPWYQGNWPAIRAAALAAQPWCSVPNCRRQDLTVDHVKPRSLDEGVQVLCRFHNSQKATADKARLNQQDEA